MAAGGGDDVDLQIAALSSDDAGASHILRALLDEWDDRVRDALLHALHHAPDPTARQRAVMVFAHRPSAGRDEHIVDGLLAALDDPEPQVRGSAVAVLYLIAVRERNIRPRIVEALRHIASNDPWEVDGQHPLRQQAARFLVEIAPSVEEIEEMRGSSVQLEVEIANLQTALDAWGSTVYASTEERRQALDDLLQPYDRKPTVKAAALSRLLDRLTQLVEIVGPLEGEASEPASIYDLMEAGMADTRERQPPEGDDESEAAEPAPYGSKEFIGEREFEYAHGYYPRWLKRDLVDGAFPWDVAQATTLARFLEEYTLHDSLIVGLWLDPDTGATLVVRWDPVWVNYAAHRIDFWPEGRMADALAELRHGGDVAFWPFLVIRIERVYHLWQYGDPIENDGWRFSDVRSAFSGTITEDRRLTMAAMSSADEYEDDEDVEEAEGQAELVPPGAQETVIIGRNGYELRLVHDPPVSLLCLSRPGTILHVPGLEIPPADSQQ